MELTEKAEEILELMWIETDEKDRDTVPISDLEGAEDEAVEQLVKSGYITAENGSIRLTRDGRPYARNVVRRHRLAERLLTDVLGTGDSIMHEKACKFEHLLDLGLDESICTLLGHPKVCPHGKPIPPGRCCREAQKEGHQVVSALSGMTPGQSGKVAYVYAPVKEQFNKLTAMGILPGAPITLTQKYPSFIFRIRETQFAVDKDIADTVYVRLVDRYNSGDLVPGDSSAPRRRRRGFPHLFNRHH